MDHRFELTETKTEEDPTLARVDDELAREDDLSGTMGWGRSAAPADAEGDDLEECPFEMGVAQPRALGLLKLHELTSAEVPPEIAATVGRARVPIVLVHSMTPFSRFGYPPTRVWGLGYQADPLPEELVPVDYAPKSEFLEIANVGTEVALEISGGGRIEADAELAAAASAIPGITVNGLSAGASADANVSLALGLKLYVLEIMAGLVGRGVRWDFVEQDDRMDRTITMVQTVLVPDDLDAIDMDVRVWVRRRRRFFDLKAARTWLISPQRMTVDIER